VQGTNQFLRFVQGPAVPVRWLLFTSVALLSREMNWPKRLLLMFIRRGSWADISDVQARMTGKERAVRRPLPGKDFLLMAVSLSGGIMTTNSNPGVQEGAAPRDEVAWLRSVVEGTAGSVGDDFLRNLVRHMALAVGVSAISP